MPDNVKRGAWVARVLQTVLNIGLLLLGVILIVFLAKETYALIQVLFINSAKSSKLLAD